MSAAAYNAAYGKDRRRVHRALSVVAEKLQLVERSAWHAAKAHPRHRRERRAAAETVAGLAAERGGFASRARVLVEASVLTPAGGRKHARLVRAAEAALAAGTGRLAKDLIDQVDEELLDEVSRGRLTAVGAGYSLFVAAPTLTRAGADMLAAARLFHGRDPGLEQLSLIKAWDSALASERRTAGVDWTDLGRRFAEGARVQDGEAATILRGLSALILEPFPEAVAPIRAALDVYDRMDATSLLRFGQSCVALATAMWDVGTKHRLLEKWAAAARDAGSLQTLDNALWVLAVSEAMSGTPRRAVQYMEQVRELRRAIGYHAEHVTNVAVLAWSATPREQVLAMADATYAMGFAGVHATALATLATTDIAEGRYAEAYELLKPLVDDPFFHVTPLSWADFAEAAAHCGHHEEAAATAGKLTALAGATGSSYARGVASRARAVVAAVRQAAGEQDFRDAVTELDGCGVMVDDGRAHLAYGEWLRRTRRLREARPHLQRAAELFDRAGADPFTARATRELEAAGGTRQEPMPGRPAQLTPQELTVAELAAEGNTNAEIGATMFLSANTIDYHLRKVCQKLGISSRRQLADRLGRP